MTLENYRKVYKEYLKDKGFAPDDEFLSDEDIKIFVQGMVSSEDFNKYKDLILDK